MSAPLVSKFIKAAASVVAIALALTLYTVSWSYAAYLVVPNGLVALVLVSALARDGRAARNDPARWGAGDVAASLALGLFGAVIAAMLTVVLVGRGGSAEDWVTRCGVAHPEHFWRIARATSVLSVPLALACTVGPPGRRVWKTAGRNGAGRLAKARGIAPAATLVYLGLTAALAPVISLQIAGDLMVGQTSAAVLLLWPTHCAGWWTVWEWGTGRRKAAVRVLRIASAVCLVAGIAFSAIVLGPSPPDANPWDTCDGPFGRGSWHLLGNGTAAVVYVALAALALLASDPAARPGGAVQQP